MLPLRDNIPSSRFPAATLGIIAINALVFLKELKLGPHLEQMLLDFAIVPARYTQPDVAQYFSAPEQIFAFFSSMFLHGGWIHLLGNMWTLWIFGDNVEDRLGRSRYVGLYLVSGIAAALLHIFFNAGSLVPTIGASGAIAGVMGAYFRFYPFAKVETVVPPFFFGPTFRQPPRAPRPPRGGPARALSSRASSFPSPPAATPPAATKRNRRRRRKE